MNKILLKTAAAVNIAAAAIIYIACSGDDGSKGDPGAPCSASPSATVAGGIDISCPGSAVVTLSPGNAGPGGGGSEGCYLQPATSGFDVICGTANVGNVGGPGTPGGGGCTISSSGPYYLFVCGTDQYQMAKAWCTYQDGGTGPYITAPYDPDTYTCDPTGGVKTSCSGVQYSEATQFCKTASVKGKDTLLVFARCKPSLDKVDEYGHPTFTVDEITGVVQNGEYDPKTSFCQNSNGGFYSAVKAAGPPPTENEVQYGDSPSNGSKALEEGTIVRLCAAGDYSTYNGYKEAYDLGQFTVADFCLSSKIYPKCKSSVGAADAKSFTSTEFCVVSAGEQVKLGQAATGEVASRCGTEKGYFKVNYIGLDSAGAYHGDVNFCAGTTNQSIAPLCKGWDGTTLTNATYAANALPDAVSAGGNGRYDVSKNYCELKTKSTGTGFDGEVKKLAVCGTATNYNPTTHFCLTTNNTVYPLCNVASAGGTYDPATQVCDRNRIVLPTIDVAKVFARNRVVSATNGELYGFKTFGTAGTWLTNNLSKYIPYANAVSGGTYTKNLGISSWSAALAACPDGYDLPTVAQWDALIAASSNTQDPAVVLREPTQGTVASNKWPSNLPAATAANGFNAIPVAADPAGLFPAPNGISAGDGYAAWWTKGEDATSVPVGGTVPNNSYLKYFTTIDASVKQGSAPKGTQISVRCIKK